MDTDGTYDAMEVRLRTKSTFLCPKVTHSQSANRYRYEGQRLSTLILVAVPSKVAMLIRMGSSVYDKDFGVHNLEMETDAKSLVLFMRVGSLYDMKVELSKKHTSCSSSAHLIVVFDAHRVSNLPTIPCEHDSLTFPSLLISLQI